MQPQQPHLLKFPLAQAWFVDHANLHRTRWTESIGAATIFPSRDAAQARADAMARTQGILLRPVAAA